MDLINEICKEQNFDELLLKLLKQSKEEKISSILESINNNPKLQGEIKKQLYKEIFEYVNEINECYKSNIKDIFSMGAAATIEKIQNEIMSNIYYEFKKKYYNLEILNLKEYFTTEDLKILNKLGINIKSKNYTQYEFDLIKQELWFYMEPEDEEPEIIEDLKQMRKYVGNKGVSQSEFDKLIKKIDSIDLSQNINHRKL